MKIAAAVIFMMIYFAVGAVAAPMMVRSGDHDGFTRVTISPVSRMTWEFRHDGTNFSLRLSEPDGNFDLTRVFARISKSRLNSISATDNVLRMKLSCECDVDVFRAGPELIAVDIKDTEQVSAPLKTVEPIPGTRPPTPVTSRDEDYFSDMWMQDILRHRLTSSLGLAAPKKPEKRGAPPPPSAHEGLHGLHQQMRVIDASAPHPTGQIKTSDTPTHTAACPEDRELAFLQGEPPDDPFEDMARLRRDAFTVTGRVNATAAFELVEYYVALGMGKEAIDLADLFRLTGRRAEIAAALALVVDDQAIEADLWPESKNCTSGAFFWTLLASPSQEKRRLDTTKIDAAIGYFLELSPQLKTLLGKRLATRFDNMGHKDAGARVREMSGRSRSQIPLEFDAYPNTVGSLQDNPPLFAAPAMRAEFEDVLTRVESNWASGEPMSRATRDLLASHAFERRGHPDADIATEALIRAALLSGDMADAGALMARLGNKASEQIENDYLQGIVRAPSDADFLVSAQHLVAGKLLHGNTGIVAVARRAEALGFQTLAKRLLTAAGSPPDLERTKPAVQGPQSPTRPAIPAQLEPPQRISKLPSLQSARILLEQTASLKADLERLSLGGK